MGRHTYVRLEDEDGNPGCVGGLLQILDYHHWLKRMLLRRKKGRSKSITWTETPKHAQQTGKGQEISDAEINSISVKGKTGSVSKRSMKARLKALIAADVSEEDDAKCRDQGTSTRYLQKSLYADPSHHDLDKRSAAYRDLTMLLKHGMDTTAKVHELHLVKAHETTVASNEGPSFEKRAKSPEDLSNQMNVKYGRLKRCLTQKDFKGNLDVLEFLKVNKEQFVENLHELHAAFASQHPSRNEAPQTARLIKSGSFPSVNSSHIRLRMPSTLEQKHKENWPLKGKKLLPTTKDDVGGHLNVRDISTSDDTKSGKLQRVRRSASLTESMDRYAQLFNHDFTKEVTRHLSRSLKLRNEKDFASVEYVPKTFRRRLSLPELDSFSFLPFDGSNDAFASEMPVSGGVDSPQRINTMIDDEAMLLRPHVSPEEPVLLDFLDDATLKDAVEVTDASPDAKCPTTSTMHNNEVGFAGTGKLCEGMDELPIQQIFYQKWQRADITADGKCEAHENLISNPEISSEAGDVESTIFPISEGLHSESSFPQVDKTNSGINLPGNSIAASKSRSLGKDLLDSGDNVDVLDALCNIREEEKHDLDFHYIKYVLHLLGLTRKDQLQTGKLLDQPLDPELFEETEVDCSLEPKCSIESAASTRSQHKLLFDLIDEALLDTFERSRAYYPKALSSSCQLRPMPTGYRVLEEVWLEVSRHLRNVPELQQSLDSGVAYDFTKYDGWMNLQMETECVALELEDMILDELLEEMISEDYFDWLEVLQKRCLVG
ncbi:hypothetical protein Ancab_007284 [Ancistrocladus abbreviatus]